MEAKKRAMEEKIAVWIWARGGGGHRMAKEAVLQKMTDEYEKKGIRLNSSHDYDLMTFLNNLPFFGRLGDFSVNLWNLTQEKGDLKTQKILAYFQTYFDKFFSPFIYFKMRKILMSLPSEPALVVSTQMLCTKTIVRAIQNVNRIKKWNMHLRLYMTDMPSSQATHFFRSLKKIGRHHSLHSKVVLYSAPLLKKDEDEKLFWKKNCGAIKVITNEDLPIRKAFLDTKSLKEKIDNEMVELDIHFNEQYEKENVLLGLSPLTKFSLIGDIARFRVQRDDKVALLMLGTIPNHRAVLQWIETMVSLAEEKAYAYHLFHDFQDAHYYFFVYCGPSSNQGLSATVFAKLKKLREEGMLPENLSIIPFTNQGDREIAALIARSDTTITRSGGSSTMELLHLFQNKDLPKRKNRLTLIHSDGLEKKYRPYYDSIAIKLRLISQFLKLSSPEKDIQKVELFLTSEEKEDLISEKMEELRKKPRYSVMPRNALQNIAIKKLLIERGIVLWEAGNVYYLIKHLKAEVTNPEFAVESLRMKFFETLHSQTKLEFPEFSTQDNFLREAFL